MKKFFSIMTVAAVALSAVAGNASKLWVVGNGVYCGWNDREALEIHGTDSVFTGTFHINGKEDFKFMTVNSWGNPEWGVAPDCTVDSTGTVKLATGSNDSGYGKFNLPDSGNYTVTIDLSDKANPTATFVKSTAQEVKIPASVLYLLGGATPGGWALDAMTPAVQNSDNPYLFEVKSVELKGDEEFKINIGGAQSFDKKYYYVSPELVETPKDEYTMVLDNDNDYKFKVPATGTYDVLIDLKNGTPALQKVILTSESEALADAVADNAAAEYYDLQGRRVLNPADGLYIRRQGGKVTKVVL